MNIHTGANESQSTEYINSFLCFLALFEELQGLDIFLAELYK